MFGKIFVALVWLAWTAFWYSNIFTQSGRLEYLRQLETTIGDDIPYAYVAFVLWACGLFAIAIMLSPFRRVATDDKTYEHSAVATAHAKVRNIPFLLLVACFVTAGGSWAMYGWSQTLPSRNTAPIGITASKGVPANIGWRATVVVDGDRHRELEVIESRHSGQSSRQVFYVPVVPTDADPLSVEVSIFEVVSVGPNTIPADDNFTDAGSILKTRLPRSVRREYETKGVRIAETTFTVQTTMESAQSVVQTWSLTAAIASAILFAGAILSWLTGQSRMKPRAAELELGTLESFHQFAKDHLRDKTGKITPFYIADKEKELPSRQLFASILNDIRGDMPKRSEYAAPCKFDCDDYSFIFKGLIAQWYGKNRPNKLPLAIGIAWGSFSENPTVVHAMNFVFFESQELFWIEPQDIKEHAFEVALRKFKPSQDKVQFLIM